MRIGINIPKELHQRLQPLKGTMNISQICREALEAHVEKYEEYTGWLDSDDARELVSRNLREGTRAQGAGGSRLGNHRLPGRQRMGAGGYPGGLGLLEPLVEPIPHRKDTVPGHFGRHVREGLMKGKFVSPGAAKNIPPAVLGIFGENTSTRRRLHGLDERRIRRAGTGI